MGVTHSQPGDVRPAAVESFDLADHPVPKGREEDWRFTPLKRLRGLHDGTAGNGRPEGKVVVEVDAAPEVTVETVGRDDPRLGSAGTPVDRVDAQAWAAFDRATVVSVPAGAVASRPTVVTRRGEGADGPAYGHVLVELGAQAEAVVVLDHVGSATLADSVQAVLGDGSRLTLVSLQEWADDTVHVSGHRLRLGRDSRLRHVVVSLGGDLVRIHPRVDFAGPGADAELLGLYFADAGQHLEHRLYIDHSVPHCRSNVAYKGALQGADAHTVWIGDVRIRGNAVGTETYEVNRNLVLTEGARADSVPNLEIETGEVVGAGHASTTGRFDDEQLFYLQARGIPEDEARRLVVRGFFADLLGRIGIADLEGRLLVAVDAELERAGR
ncbi:MAG: Fe-S cluster assembly protein SufD [Actinomycetes bacterium]